MKSKDISKTKNKSLSLSDTELNTIIDRIHDGETMFELAKDLQIKLTTLYKYLDQNPKTKERFELAQERGIKTLVEKMLVLFNNDNPDVDPNMLVFIRERANYLKWLAPRVSSLFTEKQKIDVKQDTTLNIKWESEPDMIDVSGEIEKFLQSRLKINNQLFNLKLPQCNLRSYVFYLNGNLVFFVIFIDRSY